MTKVSSTNLSHKWGDEGIAKGFNLKLFHEQVGNEGADGGIHGCTMYLFIILSLEEEVSMFQVKLQYFDDLWDGHVGPLWKCGVLW